MAGYDEIQEEIAVEVGAGYEWVKPGLLVEWKQPFCILLIEGDSYNQQGKLQWTFNIAYARQGQAVQRAFNLEKNDYRDKRVQRMIAYMEKHHGVMHHMLLVKKPNKSRPEFPYTDFADVPDRKAGDPRVCTGAGVIDPEDPKTWTEHYRMTQVINARLDEMGMESGMDTSAMDEKQLRIQMKLMGLE